MRVSLTFDGLTDYQAMLLIRFAAVVHDVPAGLILRDDAVEEWKDQLLQQLAIEVEVASSMLDTRMDRNDTGHYADP